MNNIHSIEARRELNSQSSKEEDKLLELSCSWITKIDRELTPKEKVTLQDWLAADPKNIQSFLEVAHLWDKMSKLNRLADLFPQKLLNSPFRKFNTKWATAIAASFMMILSSSFYFSNDQQDINNSKEQYSITKNFSEMIKTTIGETRTEILSDGSKIILNTNTLAYIQYTDTARIVELHQGEIHIDVAHNKLRPLSVIVAGKIIQAVGTAFNVEVRNNTIELLVTDGKVLVAPVTKEFKIEEIKNYKLEPINDLIAISKGEMIDLLIPESDFNDSDFNIPRQEIVIKIAPLEIAASLSWRTGNLIFRGESLADAMAEISRYNNIKIELDNDSHLKQIRVAGMFKTGDINGLLNVLEKSFNIHHEKRDNNKIFLHLVDKT